MKHLEAYGWNAHFAQLLESSDALDDVARVVQEHKEAYLVRSRLGNIWAEISGKMRHQAAIRSDFPAVGDWVLLRGLANLKSEIQNSKSNTGPVQIHRILPRRTLLTRRLDTGDDQLLAVNIDLVFLGAPLAENLNLRRLERYLTMARESGAQPVILLTKADLCPAPDEILAHARNLAADAAVHPISVVTGLGMDIVKNYLHPGITAVILGSSGVGKSTLVNYLADADIQDMMQTREFDDKGRHCTTFRHLVKTPAGGLIIDTPGLRGLTLGEANDALAATFHDIEQLAAQCKFTNCRHQSEPGCAIKAALDSAQLHPARLQGYLRLHRELSALTHRETRIADRKSRKLEKRSGAQKQEREQRKWNRR